ncbi:MAG: PEP-CTERM sorting domain-containing protein [Burkholderiales bacterium]
MNAFKLALIASAALCAMQAQAYTATLTTGPTSAVAGVTTEDFEGAPVFARAGAWDFYDSTSAGASLTGDGIYLIGGISAQPQKGAISADDTWASVAGGAAAELAFGPGTSYVGFLWGSVDTYNTVTFYDGASVIASFVGGPGGLGVNQVPVGNGDQADSQYLNFWSPSITRVTFASSSNAFEIDNVSAVPEPETYALMLAGLAAVGFVARRRRAA